MKTALRISYINMALNILLALLKMTVGVFSGSQALVSDGCHSVVDVFSSLLVLVGIKLSARSSDRRHPYGHERMECVAAVLLAVLVGATGIGIAVAGMRTMCGSAGFVETPPGWTALTVAAISVFLKEGMFRYTRRTALAVNSGALLADAWHLRSDALSSLGGFIGVLGANLGRPMLDPLAAVVISVFIIKAAVSVFADAMRKMTDCSCDEGFETAVCSFIGQQREVLHVPEIKTRLFGSRILVEVTVAVNGTLSCREAFEVARSIEEGVCEKYREIKRCAVHIYPL